MSTVLTDVYSILCLNSLGTLIDIGRTEISSDAYHVIQNMVLCDKILVIGGNHGKIWRVDKITDNYGDIFSLLENVPVELTHDRYTIYDDKFDNPNIFYSDSIEQGQRFVDSGKKVHSIDFFNRSLQYIELANKLGVYLSLHPERAKFLASRLKSPNRQSISEIAIGRLENHIKNFESIEYAGVDFSVPPVAEYVINFVKKKKVDLPTAVHQIRISKNAIAFRNKCSEIDDFIKSFGPRSSVPLLQKLIQEIDEFVLKWRNDFNLGIKYEIREISLRKLWGIGSFLDSVGLGEIAVKDPVLKYKYPHLLFLNDLYKSME